MDKEPLYDYARGLNAPYWIQEIKTQKGKRIWYFATPMQLSFFVVFALVFVVMVLGLSFILNPLAKMTHSISLLLYVYVPYKLAKFYTEYEPHGKKMHIFLFDYCRYLIEFRWNKKAIYHGERVEVLTDEDIVFDKTDL
ncbi:conjugal transfer protein [Streptococcus dentiloxodontae]